MLVTLSSSPSENKQSLWFTPHWPGLCLLAQVPPYSLKVREFGRIHKERDNWIAIHFSIPCIYSGVGKHEGAGWDLSPFREEKASE